MTESSQLPTARMTAAYGPSTDVVPGPPAEGGAPTQREAAPASQAPPLLDDREHYLARVDHRATLARMRALVPAAALGWIAFFGLDVVFALWVVPTSLAPFAGLRLLGLLVLLGAGVVLRRVEAPSPRLVLGLDVAMMIATAGCLSVMGLIAGGIASPYHALVVLVILGRAAVLPHRWQDGLWRLSIPAAVNLLVLAAASGLWADVQAQWAVPASVGQSFFSAALLLGAWLLAVIGSHHAWALRRRVFESRSLGRYKLRRLIGRGGMGEVWLARDVELDRDVALKVLRPDDDDPQSVTRFEREIRATAALRHPNTIRIFNHGVSEDGLWYYAMELLEGETLQALVHRVGPLHPARAAALIAAAARALAEAHHHGLVHRDIKPENLFVTHLGGEDDVVKVLDFGIARFVEDERGLTSTGLVNGTPAYMAPEVATGGPASPASDIYGLGATLYFALTGAPPFDGPDAGTVMRQHVNVPPARVSTRSPHPITEAAEEVVMCALSKDPQDRFEDATAFATALRLA